MKIVAEIGSNHMGREDWMKKTIDAAKWAGADFVKFQCYQTETLLHPDADELIREMYKRSEYPREKYEKAFAYCEEVGIPYGCSVYHRDDIDFVRIHGDPSFLKISSFEITNIPLIEYASGWDDPLIISTGMATADEIHNALLATDGAWEKGLITLMICTSAYPARAEEMYLSRLNFLNNFLPVHKGLSDHSLGNVAPILATAFGVEMLEKHFMMPATDSPDMGHSMMPNEFKNMVYEVQRAEKMLQFHELGPLSGEMVSLPYRNYSDGRCKPH